jgi:PAS domain S-box-containing protein
MCLLSCELEMLEEDSSVLTEGPLIWAVDDDPDQLELMEQLLGEAGYRFGGFLSGQALLDGLAGEGAPALVLLDMMMPGMSGLECLRALRAMPGVEELPVVVVTALTSESTLLNAFEAGADDIIYKPFGIVELMSRLKLHLQRARQLRELRQRSKDMWSLTELSKALSGKVSMPALVEVLGRTARETLGAQLCHVYRLDAGGERWVLIGDERCELALERLPEVAQALAQRRSTLLDAHGAGLLGLELEGRRGVALYPMVSEGALVGVLVLGRSGGERGERLGTIMADLGAVALQRLTLLAAAGVQRQRVDSSARALGKAGVFLENIIGSCPDAIVAAERDGRIVVFNPAAERILGWSQQEALGMDVRRLYPEGVAREIMRQMREEANGGAGRLERWRESLVDRGGEQIPVTLSAAILYDEVSGTESGSVGVFTDLRPRLALESQLAEAAEAVERSKQQVVVVELAGAAAHELNQPLTALMARAELLPRLVPDLPDTAMRALDGMLRESERIAEIVKRLGQLTQYRTLPYVGGSRIMDLGEEPSVEESKP